MSSWRDDSEVAGINRLAGTFVKVSPETFEVVDKSLWAGKASQGTFDVTFESMSDLWKFGDAQEDQPKPPSRAAVEQRRGLVDYRAVELDRERRAVRVPPNVRIGLGGIAKGYIVQRGADLFRERGVRSFLLQAGGDLYASGRKPDGAPWVSGIQDPRGSKGSFFAVLELTDRAFSTAGDYARSYRAGGKRYHHIIDPRTGYPATQSRSVTVWAPDAFVADVIDDAVFILGPEAGLELVKSLPDVGVVIVDAENEVYVSERIKDKVRILKHPTDGI
jgi:thiamine biosynthesis lipoprotein